MKPRYLPFALALGLCAAGGAIYADEPLPGPLLALPGSIGGFGFASPGFLFGQDPRAAAYNPAFGATLSRSALSASAGAGSSVRRSSWSSAEGTAAFAAPASFGSWHIGADAAGAKGATGDYAEAPGASVLAGVSWNWSEGLDFGVSAGGAFLSGDGRSAGISASAGAAWTYSVPKLGPAKASFALLGMGPSLDPWRTYAPAVRFTPLAATELPLYSSRSFAFKASALAALPGCSDLVGMLGASVSLGEVLLAEAAWSVDARSLSSHAEGGDYAYRCSPRALPSISLLFNATRLLNPSASQPGKTFWTGGGVGPAAGTGVSADARVLLLSAPPSAAPAPSMRVGPLNASSFSPLKQEHLDLPVSILPATSADSWSLTVYGPDRAAAFNAGAGNPPTSPSVDKPPRLLAAADRKAVPAPIVVRVPASALSKDGVYTVRAWVRDFDGRIVHSKELKFSVDASAPSAAISVSGPSVFSPNGDGVRDLLSISQAGSVETLWSGVVKSADGKAVRSYSWKQSSPISFVWDGADDSGRTVPDGRYSYTLEAQDEAGNALSRTLTGLVVSAAATPVLVGLDGAALTPGTAMDSLNAAFIVPNRTGLKDWTFSLEDSKGRSVRSWKGAAADLDVFPDRLVLDGRDVQGNRLPDGAYRLKATLSYENGNTPIAASEPFSLIGKAPAGRVRASSSTLLRGAVEPLRFYHLLDRGAGWTGTLSDQQGRVVREFDLGRGGESELSWNGLDSAGNPVPEGEYRYAAQGRGPTGLVGESPAVRLSVLPAKEPLALLAERPLFSPKGAPERFVPVYSGAERVASYDFAVSDSSGKTVFAVAGYSVPPASFAWNGRDSAGLPVPDGDYRAGLSLRYEGGASALALSAAVALDGTAPEAVLVLDTPIFSPNGDGRLDSLKARIGASPEDEWFLAVLDGKGRTAASFRWKGQPPADFSWNGLGDDGSLVPDGSYRLRLSSVDAAGNSFSKETGPFVLDARIPVLRAEVDRDAFSPNGDGYADSVALRLTSSLPGGLSSVSVTDETGAVVRRLSASSVDTYHWDGKTDSGAKAPDGVYLFLASISYSKGDIAELRSPELLLDSAGPDLSVRRAPDPFSPDGDGVDDALTFAIVARDASAVADWMLSIADAAGTPFVSFSGKGAPPASLDWDGSDFDGNPPEAAADYSWQLTVRDVLGNASSISGTVSTDVFVLRDGDRLKIRISSITFPPNAASLSTGNAETDKRNRWVLDRIAATLAKFSSYRVRIEGHAVNLSGTEREEREELVPLSGTRARAVLEELVSRGVSRERLSSTGLGGREPIVPHGDAENRWRNRRVEFILVR